MQNILRNKYRYIGLGCVALILGMAIAGGKTRLIDTEYNFGVLKEQDGSVTGRARVVNEGPDTTYVRDVRPSCGCTGAEYSTALLAPGDTAFVSFTYNPIGRPGTIGKTVKIYMGDDDERHVVRLTGRVVGSEETLRRNYPVACGALRLSDSIVDLGRIPENSGRHSFLRIVNATADSVTPLYVNDNKAIAIDVTPKVLVPGDIGTFGIYLNTKFTDTIGRVEYHVPVWAEGDSVRATVSIRALIEPEVNDTVTVKRPI